MPSPKLYPAIDLGPLAVDAINAVLGTELNPGLVYLSERAHQHMAEDHPEDYPLCFPYLRLAISTPSCIGQAPKRTGNFEILRRVNDPAIAKKECTHEGDCIKLAPGADATRLAGWKRGINP